MTFLASSRTADRAFSTQDKEDRSLRRREMAIVVASAHAVRLRVASFGNQDHHGRDEHDQHEIENHALASGIGTPVHRMKKDGQHECDD